MSIDKRLEIAISALEDISEWSESATDARERADEALKAIKGRFKRRKKISIAISINEFNSYLKEVYPINPVWKQPAKEFDCFIGRQAVTIRRHIGHTLDKDFRDFKFFTIIL